MLLPPLSALTFFPDYRSTQTPWQALTPVAAWAIKAIRPTRFVELGSYRGDSFLSFVQAGADTPGIRDFCAIDTWAGDIHTREYGEDVFRQFSHALAQRDDPRARFLRTTFAEAVSSFDDGSIDLLHIDGAHDYESVREDFETWLPKMTAEGVILLHDTMVRQEPYAVWQLWDEIVEAHPGRTFNFTFSNGLGVLCLGTAVDNDFKRLVGLPANEQDAVDRMMRLSGHQVLATTEFEASLFQATGLPDAHVFAEGEDLIKVRALMKAASISSISAERDRFFEEVRNAISGQVDDIFAALEPKLSAYIAEALNQRISRLLVEQIDDVFAALEPKLEAYLASERS